MIFIRGTGQQQLSLQSHVISCYNPIMVKVASFNLADHNILSCCLRQWVEISGLALEWFTSYLSDRQFFVFIADKVSNKMIVLLGTVESLKGQTLDQSYSTSTCSLQGILHASLTVSVIISILMMSVTRYNQWMCLNQHQTNSI